MQRKEEGKKYVVSPNQLRNLLCNIVELVGDYKDVHEIMYKEKMHRAIFGSNIASEKLEEKNEETSWIRVRAGDVNCDGTSPLTVSYKSKVHNKDRTVSSQFIAEDYYSVVQFFKDIGFHLISEQETLRTKYVFYYEKVKYVICLDEWPQIRDKIFVTITASDNVSNDGFSHVCNSLKINELAMQVGYVDIDRAYYDLIGKKASEIRQIRFNLPLDSP
jgi:hypothetical protein